MLEDNCDREREIERVARQRERVERKRETEKRERKRERVAREKEKISEQDSQSEHHVSERMTGIRRCSVLSACVDQLWGTPPPTPRRAGGETEHTPMRTGGETEHPQPRYQLHEAAGVLLPAPSALLAVEELRYMVNQTPGPVRGCLSATAQR